MGQFLEPSSGRVSVRPGSSKRLRNHREIHPTEQFFNAVHRVVSVEDHGNPRIPSHTRGPETRLEIAGINME